MPNRRPVLTTALAAVVLLAAGGCEDTAARRRAEVQQVILTAVRDLGRVPSLPVAGDAAGNVRSELRRIIGGLRAASEGGPAQQAAAARLEAAAHRRLAEISANRARHLESEHRVERSVLHGMLDAAGRLRAMAEGLEAISVETEQRQLAEDRQSAETTLAEQRARLESLQTPISEAEQRNEAAQEEVSRLRREADELRRQASDLGPAEGYPLFERALELAREADQIEYDIAHRQLDVEYTAANDYRIATSRVEQLGAHLKRIEGARASLDEVAVEAAEEAEQTRRKLGDLRDELSTRLSALRESAAGPLAEAYEEAGSALEQAASRAAAAARQVRDDEADAARLEAARAWQELGDLRAGRARGLKGQVGLLQRLSGEAQPADARDAAAAQEALRAAVEQATAAYGNARRNLEGVSVRVPRRRIEAVKAGLARLEAALQGREAPAAAGATGAGAPAEAAASGAGAASPDALAEALRGGDPNADVFYFDAANPQQRRLRDTVAGVQEAQAELWSAMRDTFDVDLGELVGQMGGGAGLAGLGGDASVGQVAGDRGTIVLASGGRTVPVEIMQVDGRWFIDGGAFFAQMGGAQAAEMMSMAAEPMREIAGRVRAGEFETAQQAFFALGQTISRQMQGGGVSGR